jgi:hypothetical protein
MASVYYSHRTSVMASAFGGTNPKEEPTTSGLLVIRSLTCASDGSTNILVLAHASTN